MCPKCGDCGMLNNIVKFEINWHVSNKNAESLKNTCLMRIKQCKQKLQSNRLKSTLVKHGELCSFAVFPVCIFSCAKMIELNWGVSITSVFDGLRKYCSLHWCARRWICWWLNVTMPLTVIVLAFLFFCSCNLGGHFQGVCTKSVISFIFENDWIFSTKLLSELGGGYFVTLFTFVMLKITLKF